MGNHVSHAELLGLALLFPVFVFLGFLRLGCVRDTQYFKSELLINTETSGDERIQVSGFSGIFRMSVMSALIWQLPAGSEGGLLPAHGQVF